MKKIMMLLAATMLLFDLNGQAMASFADGDLIQVVYSSGGGYETATDLGSIASLTTPLTVICNTNNFNIASLGSGATYANSYVAYYAYMNDSNYNDNVWTSGNQGGQTIVGSVANSNFANAAEAMGGLYSRTSGGAQVTVSTSNTNSYYTQMNLAGLGKGQMAGYTPNGDAEANLAALATTGYVQQTLYYYIDDGSMSGSMPVAYVLTLADGSSEIFNPDASGSSSSSDTTTPVPPSILLMGSGLMCLLVIRQKMISAYVI